jgi:hypothetical protein
MSLKKIKETLRVAFAAEPPLIPFRGENPATAAWRALCQRVGSPFLNLVLRPVVEREHSTGTKNKDGSSSSVFAPSSPGSPQDKKLADRSERDAQLVLSRCYKNIETVHPHMREALAAAVGSDASSTFGTDEFRKKRRLALRNLFFLRYLQCGCVNPTGWGVSVPGGGELSPAGQTHCAAVGRALGLMVSDVTASSGAVQIFLDRLVDTGVGCCNPLDLRNFVVPSVSSSCSSSSSSLKDSVKRGGAFSPTKKGTKKESKKESKRGAFSPSKKSSKRESKKGSGLGLSCFQPMPSLVAIPGENDPSPRWMPPPDLDLSDLSTSQLADLLFRQGLVDLVDVFQRNAVDGKRLLALREADLVALGVSHSQRKELSSVVALLRRA